MKIISYFSSTFVILSECVFNGFKCLIWHQKKHLLSLFLILIKTFIDFFNSSGNSIYALCDKVLQLEILMYSPSIFSIAQADPLLIQLSIPYKGF